MGFNWITNKALLLSKYHFYKSPNFRMEMNGKDGTAVPTAAPVACIFKLILIGQECIDPLGKLTN